MLIMYETKLKALLVCLEFFTFQDHPRNLKFTKKWTFLRMNENNLLSNLLSTLNEKQFFNLLLILNETKIQVKTIILEEIHFPAGSTPTMFSNKWTSKSSFFHLRNSLSQNE